MMDGCISLNSSSSARLESIPFPVPLSQVIEPGASFESWPVSAGSTLATPTSASVGGALPTVVLPCDGLDRAVCESLEPRVN